MTDIVTSNRTSFPAWRFVKHHPETKSRNPLQSELLNQESFKPADALVRESIQNSLDAKLADAKKVVVRIYVSGEAGALSKEEVSPYFQGFWPHVEQCVGGGQVAASLSNGPCRFVVIEDFGTVGLTGDVSAARMPEGVPNNYYYFLRAEGMSQKGSSSLGRWGVGKYVFPKSSGVNAFIAFTKRFDDDGPALLVGQSVLMNHSLEDVDYDPDGWWAVPGDGLQMPFADSAMGQKVAAQWRMQRKNETGLSIVIPYVEESLTGKDFVQAVIRAYFGAILAGGLEVRIEEADNSLPIELRRSNVLELAQEFFDGDERDRIVSDIQLLAVQDNIPSDCRMTSDLIAARAGKGWSSTTIDDETAAKMRLNLEAGRPVQVTVPIEIRRKDVQGETVIESYFRILFQQDEALRQKPLFMRGGIIIPQASRSSLTGVRAICIVEDEALTRMLGDAENPAHTTWTANDKIRARYVRGNDLLLLIKAAPQKIYELVLDAALEEQRIIFADIFSVPVADANNKKRQSPTARRRAGGSRGRSGGAGNGPRVQPLTDVEREDLGGFTVIPTEHGRAGALKRVDIAVGYETRRGDAISKWRKEDFDLATFSPSVVGGVIENQAGNSLTVSVQDPTNFKLTVLGFDTNRDLRIRARGHSK